MRMTLDELLQVIRAGKLDLVAHYLPERGAFLTLHGFEGRPFYEDEWNAVTDAAQREVGILFALFRLHDASICVDAGRHRHVTARHPVTNEEYQKCEACEQRRIKLAPLALEAQIYSKT